MARVSDGNKAAKWMFGNSSPNCTPFDATGQQAGIQPYFSATVYSGALELRNPYCLVIASRTFYLNTTKSIWIKCSTGATIIPENGGTGLLTLVADALVAALLAVPECIFDDCFARRPFRNTRPAGSPSKPITSPTLLRHCWRRGKHSQNQYK